jgi:hypothetical protein
MKVDLSEAAIDRAVRAHAYAFAVLQWLDARGRRDAPSLAALEQAIQDAEQATRWVEASWAELPAEDRPEVALAPAVGAMLASFFEVSFRVEVSRGLDGALLAAKILHRPSPMKRPRLGKTALEALQRLAIAEGRRPSADELRAWLGRVDPADLEVWLYAVELVHRSEGRTAGIPAMTLWRRMELGQRGGLHDAIAAARERLLRA